VYKIFIEINPMLISIKMEKRRREGDERKEKNKK